MGELDIPVSGLKAKVPAMVRATTRSGEVTKECVAGLASLRPVKLPAWCQMCLSKNRFLELTVVR
jgi:hypothetical protein